MLENMKNIAVYAKLVLICLQLFIQNTTINYLLFDCLIIYKDTIYNAILFQYTSTMIDTSKPIFLFGDAQIIMLTDHLLEQLYPLQPRPKCKEKMTYVCC